MQSFKPALAPDIPVEAANWTDATFALMTRPFAATLMEMETDPAT
jgi:hypothetical protein